MKNLTLLLGLLTGVYISSCGVMKAKINSENKTTHEITKLLEKSTIGDEKVIALALQPPLFGALPRENFAFGIAGNYSGFKHGNAYVYVGSVPSGVSLLRENLPVNNFSGTEITMRYSYPLLKFSGRDKLRQYSFYINPTTVGVFDSHYDFKHSINLRAGYQSYINQFSGFDFVNKEIDAYKAQYDYSEKTHALTAGLSYVLFSDYQFKMTSEGNEIKGQHHFHVEFYADFLYCIGGAVACFDKSNSNIQEYPEQTADLVLKQTGLMTGVKFQLPTFEKGFFNYYNFNLGYRELPHFDYETNGYERKRNRSFMLSMEFGIQKRLKSKNLIL